VPGCPSWAYRSHLAVDRLQLRAVQGAFFALSTRRGRETLTKQRSTRAVPHPRGRSGSAIDDLHLRRVGGAHLQLFFNDANAGEEILFAVDERSLAEASGLPEDATSESLASAVRMIVGPHWVLTSLSRRIWRWRRDGQQGAHPALPLLAMTVLAASHMGELSYFAAHNYYVPLRRLFNADDKERGAPGTFMDHIEYFWMTLLDG